MEAMRAVVLEQAGAGLVLRRVPRPVPANGEVLVRVAASGVNPLDAKIAAGAAAHARVTPPMILGIDLAGVIAEVGAGVTRLSVGDEVYGMTGGVGDNPGSLAEYAAVDQDLLARKPARLSMTEAAALPLAVITAWEGLVDRGDGLRHRHGRQPGGDPRAGGRADRLPGHDQGGVRGRGDRRRGLRRHL